MNTLRAWLKHPWSAPARAALALPLAVASHMATASGRAIAESNLGVTMFATAEEQQVNQPGLIFNHAVTGQAFPTAPNYFSSTRVTAGRRILYTVSVNNGGDLASAAGATLTVYPPAGGRVYQGSISGPAAGLCNGPDVITCSLGALAAGQSLNIQFQWIADGGLAPGTVLNAEAIISGDAGSPTNNQAFTQHTVLAAADSIVADTAAGQVAAGVDIEGQPVLAEIADQVSAGARLRYQVTVQNNGPSSGLNATVQINLPGGTPSPLTFLSGSTTCQPSAITQNTIFCSPGTLTPGARRTFDLLFAVDPNVADNSVLALCAVALQSNSNTSPPGQPPVINGAPTGVLIWDPLASNSTACTNVTVKAHAWLTAAKTNVAPQDGSVEPDHIQAGSEHRYRLSVVNNGPSTAEGVVVTDVLPAHLGFKLAGDPGCSAVSKTVTCDMGDLLPGASTAVDLVVSVNAAAPDGVRLTNVMTAAMATAGSGPVIAQASALVIGRSPKLELAAGVDSLTPAAGSNVTVQLEVRNTGAVAAQAASLEVTLPVGLTYVVHGEVVGAEAAAVKTIPVGALAPGETKRYDLVAKLSPSAACGATLTTGVKASAANASAAAAEARLAVACVSDLALAKIAVPDQIAAQPGSMVFALFVDNRGPSVARQVKLDDTLVSNLPFTISQINANVNGAQPGASCTPAAPIANVARKDIACTLGAATLDPGETWAVQITVQVAEGQDINNLARVSGGNGDPAPDNNQASASLQQQPIAGTPPLYLPYVQR